MPNLPNSDGPVLGRGIARQPEFVVSGVLGRGAGAEYIQSDEGRRVTMSEPIWAGYFAHWLVRRKEKNLRTTAIVAFRKPVDAHAPDEPAPTQPYIDLYYNECLPGYLSSLFGHLAINVDGKVFSFSETLNENEEMSLEEFLYRPALGEFSGHPDTHTFNVDDPKRPYYEKFGRRFMRAIHALRIEGLDTARLTERLRMDVTMIQETPPNPRRPHKYRDFHFLHRSCTSIIRDALRNAGLREVSGILPRELFLNIAYQATRPNKRGFLSVRAFRLDQLKVPERAHSRPSPIMNPLNRLRMSRLRSIPGSSEILPR